MRYEDRQGANSALAGEGTGAELLRQAKDACGATTDTEAIRVGLESLIRKAAYEWLAAFGGTEPNAQDYRGAAPSSRTRRKGRRVPSRPVGGRHNGAA